MSAPVRHSWIDSVAACPRQEWDALADQYDTPLMDWDWLRILEESGSVCPEEGWIPQHLLVRRGGRLVAAAPLYVKTHSAGEFVFDYAWAEVASTIGCDYYPKLVAMSPLTPAIGYRFLIDRLEEPRQIVEGMLVEIYRLCRENRLHGFSVLWPEEEFARLLPQERFSSWDHQHFGWENPGFACFEDYVAVFAKNQRRNIRREVQSMAAEGLTVRTFPAAEAPDSVFGLMHRYYRRTNDQFGPWAARFLTPRFFELLKDCRAARVVFCGAWSAGEADPVGLSMLLRKGPRLIGRYWGARRFVANLHFNLCYYEPIRWAIENGIRVFDPGMGSSHKLRRGFRAIATQSLHHFHDPRMEAVMRMNIDRINRYEREHIDELNAGIPLAGRHQARRAVATDRRLPYNADA